MRHELFTEVVLQADIPEKGLKKADVATAVERYVAAGQEDGYSLEIFNAFGDTIAVVTVPESLIEPLTEDEVFTVRSVRAG
ncbi:MAG: DUF4926 domain-containing protein [Sedimentisphaerales bacterium]|nr:DUF4926 domain-containing protein [Sedimentisphaerales bacterium]